jgi:hypothetical protein
LTKAQLFSANEELQREKAIARSLAVDIGKNSRIVRLARRLHLRPNPSGDDKYSWTALCPRAHDERWHKLSISTKTKHFSCAHCDVSGGTKDLDNFYTETVKLNFAPLTSVLQEQIDSNEMVKKIYVNVSWYYDLISPTLKLHRTECKKILTGKPFHKKGSGYMSEEGFCRDYWFFNFSWPHANSHQPRQNRSVPDHALSRGRRTGSIYAEDRYSFGVFRQTSGRF